MQGPVIGLDGSPSQNTPDRRRGPVRGMLMSYAWPLRMAKTSASWPGRSKGS